MTRQKRQKASDVFEKNIPFIGRKVGFEEAFPTIKNITAEVEQSGEGVTTWNKVSHRDKHSIGEYFDCSNRLCYNGGTRIGFIVRNMVGAYETHHESSVRCQGYEGSPKGRRKYGPCFNLFKITIDIEYKEPDESKACAGVAR